MKTQRKPLYKRIIAVFVSFAMALSLLVAGPQEAEAGLIVNAMGCRWSAIAMNTVERTVLWGIGKAESATENDALATALNMTKRIIAGKSGIVASQTLQEVKHISAQLSALYSYTVTSTDNIMDDLQKMASNDAKNNFYTYASSPVDGFTGTYRTMVEDFNSLLDAYTAYGEDPSDANRQTLESRYQTIYSRYYEDQSADKLFTTPLLSDFLPLISPYDPSYTPEKGAEGAGTANELTDPSLWGPYRNGFSVEQTYLGYYKTYITSVTDLQNNVYDSMCSAGSVITNSAYLYLQAYRYYAEFQAMQIASDASLSESEQRTQIRTLWNNFYNASNKLVRGLNQAYESQSTVFSTYMRTWDVPTTKKISDYESPLQYGELLHKYKDSTGYDGLDFQGENTDLLYKVDVSTSVVTENQNVYQFRLVSNPTKTYAIRSSTNSTSDEDGVSRALYAEDLRMFEPSPADNDDTCPSTDYLTLLQGLDGLFSVPANMSELNDITQSNSYQHSSRLTENLSSELSFSLGSDNVHLPSISYHDPSNETTDIIAGPNFLLLRANIVYNPGDTSAFGNKDALTTLGNVSMPFDPSYQAQLDMEDDIWDHTSTERKDDKLKDKETVTMWTASNPRYSLSVLTEGDGSATVSWSDGTLANGQSQTLDCGTALTAHVYPAEGATVSSVQIVDGNGTVLENLFCDATNEDGETTLYAQEILDHMLPDDDGGYSFAFPAPYRDATLKVTFSARDKSLNAYDVTLNDVGDDASGYDAVLQFGGYDYLGKKSFKQGEQVIVSVCGYDHHVATGLVITDEQGNAVDVACEEVPSDQVTLTRPLERLYAFTMPAQDLKVTATLDRSGTVSIIKDAAPHVTHAFENLNVFSLGKESDWTHADAVDFATGDTVTISYAVSTGYTVTDINIVDANSYSPIEATIHEGNIVFTMPAASVGVVFTEATVDTSKRMLTLDPDLQGASFQFVGQDGSGDSLTQKEFGIGETVQVKAQFSDSYTFEGMVLTPNGGTENLFEAQGGSYDPESGMVTFTMPDTNATLSADLLLKPQLTLASTEGVSLSFADQDVAQKRIASGESVQVKLQVTDDTKTVQELILATGDGAENLFEAQGGSYDRASGTVTFTMPDADVTLSATLRDKTEDELYDLIVDDEGRILIYTYENLVGYSNAIRKDPERYSTADLILMNNIDATGKPAWSQGIGRDMTDIAFNGTFEGNGFCIFGMDWAGSDATALFELVGNQGTIRNLNMFDCDSLRHGQFTGSFAVYNHGRIEHCTSGAGLANTISVDPETGALVSMSELNSHLDGYGIGAGFACYNYAEGVIYACRSAAEVTAHASIGGIVGGDCRGTVSNCASNSILTDAYSDDALIGGIAAENSKSIVDDSYPGLIEGGYSSATINPDVNASMIGNISGMHEGTVIDTYYTTSENQQPFGHLYENTESNINGLDREDMRKDSFVDALSGTGSNSVTWIRSDALNDGLPRIKNDSDDFADRTIEGSGVSASGNLHIKATLAVSKLPKDSEAWQLLADAGEGNAASAAYVLSIQDGAGNEIPAELWVQSDLTYTVPVPSADAEVVALLANGTVLKPSDVSVNQSDSGYEATFTGDVAVALMVLGEEEPEDDGFDTDDEGRIIIRTYEDLVAFSDAVRNNPKRYAEADAILANNINATGKPTWTQGIGSYEGKIAYNATFEGNGYCIFGLDMRTDYAGLFELVGEQGVVKNLFLFDCDCTSPAKAAGGIAVYNHGRIEYCVNGVNLSNGVYVRPDTGALVSLREYNSSLEGTTCGGIAGDNYGTIYACRSAATIAGTDTLGGIAGRNEGAISNCAANNGVSSSAQDSTNAGGICGLNLADALIEAGYSSATITSAVSYVGNITGTQEGAITDTYYTTSEQQQAYDEAAAGGTATGINGLARGQMMKDSFVETLGAVGSNSVTWIRSDSLNAGLPRIKNPSASFADVVLSGSGASVRGNLHRKAKMAMVPLANKGEAWQRLLSQQPDGYTAISAYACGIHDAAGNMIPIELWAQSALTYTIPVSSKDVAISVLYADGSTKLLDSVQVTEAGTADDTQSTEAMTAQSEPMKTAALKAAAATDTSYDASFTTDGAAAFMVLAKDTSNSGSDDNGGSGESNNNNGGNGGSQNSGSSSSAAAKGSLAKTGDSDALTRLAALLAGTGVVFAVIGASRRRRRKA